MSTHSHSITHNPLDPNKMAESLQTIHSHTDTLFKCYLRTKRAKLFLLYLLSSFDQSLFIDRAVPVFA